MKLTVNGTHFPVAWEVNIATQALRTRLIDASLTLQLQPYGGFEVVGNLGFSLPRADERIRTSSGDIMLYGGDNLVLFSGSNTWSYTRLGAVDPSPEWERAMSSGPVEVLLEPGGRI